MRPLIGITCDYDWELERVLLFSGYYEGVFHCGGQPFLLPCLEEGSSVDILTRLDGLLLTGGQDVDAYLFGEEPHPRVGTINPMRDQMELMLCRDAVNYGVPVLGICRGMQVMNIALGGDIYQDLPLQWTGQPLICHDQKGPKWFGVHEVLLEKGSPIAAMLEREVLRTNSFHHQAVRRLATGLTAAGHTRDGVIEAVLLEHYPFFLGVQWHPERMWHKYPEMLGLFAALVDNAVVRMKGRKR